MKRKKLETVLYSAAGVAAMFVILMAVYIITSAVKVRVDVTAEKAHTLSEGTKKILGKLDSRVTIRFYCTQSDNAMPPALRTYAQRIEDLLAEYKTAAKGKLIIEKYDPKPDSEAEESARLNGVEGQATGPFGTDKIYLGVVVSLLNEKFALPWLPPEREQLLEYDISRAISRVVNHTPPVIGVMSLFPVFGRTVNPMMLAKGEQGAEPWVFVSELKKDFTVRNVPMGAIKIDDDIKVMVVVHPRDIPETTEYALDQFVLRGGKLLAFLDPHAIFDQNHDDNQSFQVIGDSSGKSSLTNLLHAWGLQMDETRVVADTTFGTRNSKNGEMLPTMLTITRAGIDEKDVVTSQIDNLLIPFAGAFIGKPADGLTERVLIKSTRHAELVDGLIATSASEQILRDFKDANVEYALAVHLSGKFKTAFPAGKPKTAGAKTEPNDAPRLKESKLNSEVVLVSDSDMLNDKVCVRVQNLMGRRVARPANGNLNFVQSVVEQFSGDDELISARSRASMNHPLTRLADMQAIAGKQWEEKIQVLETKKREMERKINELKTHQEGGEDQKLILSPEQEQELQSYQKAFAEIGRDLKEVRRNLKKDTESLRFWTQVINIGAVPTLVAISGLFLAIVKPKGRKAK